MPVWFLNVSKTNRYLNNLHPLAVLSIAAPLYKFLLTPRKSFLKKHQKRFSFFTFWLTFYYFFDFKSSVLASPEIARPFIAAH